MPSRLSATAFSFGVTGALLARSFSDALVATVAELLDRLLYILRPIERRDENGIAGHDTDHPIETDGDDSLAGFAADQRIAAIEGEHVTLEHVAVHVGRQ
jgi:hypothetical protein